MQRQSKSSLTLLASIVPAASGLLSTAFSAIGSGLLAVLKFVAGAGSANARALRALTWALLAAVASSVAGRASEYRELFFHGLYPPQRNVDKLPVRIVSMARAPAAASKDTAQ